MRTKILPGKSRIELINHRNLSVLPLLIDCNLIVNLRYCILKLPRVFKTLCQPIVSKKGKSVHNLSISIPSSDDRTFFRVGADRHLSLLAQCHQHFFPTTTKRKNCCWKSKSKRERLNKNGGGGVNRTEGHGFLFR